MKRTIYSIIPALLLLLAGCDRGNNFEDSASRRMQNAIDVVGETLLDGENGWILQYFPNTGPYGGFNMHIKFNDTKMADIRLLENVAAIPEDIYATSGEYEVKPEQSVMLTFDTRNSALHYFMNRSGGMALDADYEFLPKKWETDYMLLKGKKFGYFADLNRLPAGETVDGYKAKIDESLANMEYAAYKLKVGGRTYTVNPRYEQRQLVYIDANNSKATLSWIYTPAGIKLYLPVTVNGVEFSELSWDGNGKFANTQGNVELEKFMPTNYALFTDEREAWYFSVAEGMMSDKFKTEWDKQANSSAHKLSELYFCKDSNFKPEFHTSILRSSGNTETIELKLNLTEVDAETVNMKFTSSGGGPQTFGELKYPAIIWAFFGLTAPDPQAADNFAEAAKDENYKGRTYRITKDDDDNPKVLTMTAVDDPEYWFKLQVKKANVRN